MTRRKKAEYYAIEERPGYSSKEEEREALNRGAYAFAMCVHNYIKEHSTVSK